MRFSSGCQVPRPGLDSSRRISELVAEVPPRPERVVLDERVGRHVEREDALDARDGGWIVHGQSLRRRAQREIHVLQRARVE